MSSHRKAVDERIIFDSEVFEDVSYYVKRKHVLIETKTNGMLCVDLSLVREFCEELEAVADTYKTVRS